MTEAPNRGAWRDVTEDTTGFGEVEWRTARDLVVRPREVLDAYEKRGPTGGGAYARPTRFYLALCGVLMFYLFLIGGTKRLIERMPPDLLTQAIAASGKSRESFINDADGWLTILITPVLALFYALALVPAIKWWGGTNWRIAFRSTWALLCAWTVPILPFGPLPHLPQFMLIAQVGMLALLVLAFVRMGRGRWWHSGWGAVGKSVVVLLLFQVGAAIGSIPVFAIGALGGIYGS